MRFYVTVGVTRYELATPESMTFDEGLEVKRVSGGMDPFEVAARFGQMDPQAVLALLLVSVKRHDPATTEEDLRGLKFVDIVNTLEKEEDPVPPSEPPRGGNDSETVNAVGVSSGHWNEGSGVNSPASETTPAPGGTPPISATAST